MLVAGLAANREVYRIGFGKPLAEIGAAWIAAMAAPIPPKVVEDAPCHEVVTAGRDLDRDGAALDGLPVPISTPGWDNAPYLSAGHYITRDPDTGIQNVGNYRGQLKTPRRLGMNPSWKRAGIFAHWKYQARRADAVLRRGRLSAGHLLCVGAEDGGRSRLESRWRRDRGRAGQRGARQDRRPAGAGRGRIVIEGLINTQVLEPEAPFGTATSTWGYRLHGTAIPASATRPWSSVR